MTILYYLVIFIFSFLSSLLYEYLYEFPNYNYKYKPFKRVLVLSIFSVLILLNNRFSILILKLVLNFLMLIFMILIITKDSYKRIIGYAIFIQITTFFLEILVVKGLSIIFTSENYFYTLESLIHVSLLIDLLLIIFSRFSIFNILKNKIMLFFENNSSSDYIIISSIFCLNILCVIRDYRFEDNNLTALVTIIAFVIILLFIYTLKEKSKLDSLKLKSEYLSKINSKYESVIKDYKELKHNLMNDFIELESSNKPKLIAKEKIKKYSKDYEWLLNIDQIPSGIQGLIYLKIEQAKKYKVKFEIGNLNIKYKSLDLATRELNYLNESINILVDNAVDAVKDSKEKIVYLNFINNGKKIIFQIMNKVNNDLNLDKIGTYKYSTKQKKSGIGLNYLFTKTNKIIKICPKIINDYYISEIILKK